MHPNLEQHFKNQLVKQKGTVLAAVTFMYLLQLSHFTNDE